ncbi:MAG: serine hydrolase domain-containing protein, partial [Ginsengibacter sp.]
MIKKIILLFGVALTFSMFGFAQSNQIQKLDGSYISPAQLNNLINQLMTKAKVDGLSISILNDNKPVYVRSFGYKNKETKELLDTSTVLYAASFSKAVFAFLTMKLVQEG